MAKRKPTTKKGQRKKVKKVLGEFKAGTLQSGGGGKVTNPEQAIAIGLSEAGLSINKRKKKKGKK